MSYGVSDMSDSELKKEREALLMRKWSFVSFIASFIGGSYLLSFFLRILFGFFLNILLFL